MKILKHFRLNNILFYVHGRYLIKICNIFIQTLTKYDSEAYVYL